MAKMGEDGKLSLGYWKIRGLVAPARMMLHYANIDYNDVAYTASPKEDGTLFNTWFDEPTAKPALIEQNPLINLPWVEYKGELVTQSNAVLLFIGRIAGLNGNGETEVNKNLQIMFQFWDIRSETVRIAYAPDGKDKVDGHFAVALHTHYKKLENWLKLHGTKFFTADTPMSADFHALEMLDQQEGWARTIGKDSPLANYPLLTQYYNSMLGLDGLKKYFEGDMSKLGYNSPIAPTFSGHPGQGYGPSK